MTEPDLRVIPAVLRFLGGDPRPLPAGLGDQIRRPREARGLSIRELAPEISVDPGTVERWERLGFNPHPRLYARLVQLFGIPEPPEDAPVGERLRAQRLALGLTQEEAARLLGVCHDAISRSESGRSQVGKKYLDELRRFLL